MAKPRFLGVEFARLAKPVVAGWEKSARSGRSEERRLSAAKLKGLRTFESRVRQNPLSAGDPVARDRWPADLQRDYGPDVPNLFRFEFPEHWRGYYSLIGEPGGCRVWILYLWDHEEYSRQSGYEKK